MDSKMLITFLLIVSLHVERKIMIKWFLFFFVFNLLLALKTGVYVGTALHLPRKD